jgi:hypothetical protein
LKFGRARGVPARPIRRAKKGGKQRMLAATEYAAASRVWFGHERATKDDVAPARRPMAGARAWMVVNGGKAVASTFHPFGQIFNRSRLSA